MQGNAIWSARCWCYCCEGCISSMQYKVAFAYKLNIWSGTEENHGKSWSNWQLKSKSRLPYDQRSTGLPILVSGHHLGPATTFSILFHWTDLQTVAFSYYRALILTWGWTCNLQLPLVLPARSFSGPSLAGLVIIFYCISFETPSNLRAVFLYLFPPETGCQSFTPGQWVTPTNNSKLSCHRQTVGLSVLASGHHLGHTTNFFSLSCRFSGICCFYYEAPTLTRLGICNFEGSHFSVRAS